MVPWVPYKAHLTCGYDVLNSVSGSRPSNAASKPAAAAARAIFHLSPSLDVLVRHCLVWHGSISCTVWL